MTLEDQAGRGGRSRVRWNDEYSNRHADESRSTSRSTNRNRNRNRNNHNGDGDGRDQVLW